MTITTREQAFTAENITKFRTFDVVNGEVTLSESEYVDVLNEEYGDVSVCGFNYGSGDILLEQSPTTFNCMKSDHEDYLQTELEEQLNQEDESDLEFEVHPDDVVEEDEE